MRDDFSLRIDGQLKEIIDVERSERPLSVVLLFTTNHSNCLDSLAPFSLAEQVAEVFRPGDQIAIVVSDSSGSVIRELSSPDRGLTSDLSSAIKIANQNSYQNLNLEYGTYDTRQGLMFPMSGLKSSIRVLQSASTANDKAIVFINDIQNTRVGKREDAIRAHSTLAKENISVSWLTTRDFTSRFSLTKIPYGRRDFFFVLPDASGGIVRECRGTMDSGPVVWGRSRTEYYSFESDLNEILVRHRNRYSLRFLSGRARDSFRAVAVSLKRATQPSPRLIYPKAIKY